MKKIVTLLALVLALVPSGVAAAQSVQDTYRGESGVLGQIGDANAGHSSPSQTAASQSVPPTAAVQSSGGSLPFTGAELAVVAAGGLALLGAGIGLRRLARNTA